MPPKFTERIYQDVAYLIQPLQIILYNWQSLSVIYDRLKAARQLDQLVSQALPIILGTCRDLRRDLLTATCITCDAGSCPNHCGKVNAGPGRCSPCHGGITAGSSPHFPSPRRISPTAIAGDWNLQAGQPHHYMLRRRNGAAGLQVSYVLLQLAPKCQAVGCPERIFVNRIRKPAKGKGKGKGKQAKGKGRGKQDQPAAPHNGAPPPPNPRDRLRPVGPAVPPFPPPANFPDAHMAAGEEGG